ncbi:MAG TPA: ABC transporter permease [Moheibacter sp.]|nr:ABC transporter permease [Moheibacter sp.]
MKQILLVAKREFLAQVKNKTFIVMTILSPIIMVGIFGIIAWMMSANTDQKNIAVVDESREFITSFVSDENEIYNFYGEKDIQAIKDSLLGSKYLNALLVIPKYDGNDFSAFEKNIELTTNGNIGKMVKDKLEGKINQRIGELKMEAAGLTAQQLNNLKSNVSIKTYNLKDSETKDDKGELGDYLKFGIGMALAYVIFMFIMIYGVKVMRSVVEEKNNRVVEIIISSVKPFNLMMGKIVGTTLVAFTQFAIWITMGTILFAAGSAFLASKIKTATDLSAMSQQNLVDNPEWMTKTNEVMAALLELNYPLIIGFFLVFFILGYLFYSSIFAAIGSAVDNETDTQQFTFYPIFPMMIAMYGSMTTIDNPDGPVAFWLSMIPFTSPISMVTRLPFGVEWWEILLSLTLLIGTMLLMVFFASKIYRVGILMYGKKPSFKEMWKWIRYSN